MSKNISVVINTLNESDNLERALKSVYWANEVVVCDMGSNDNTRGKAKKLGAKVYIHKRLDFVEPARDFAISKATGDWILVLDPDEEIPEKLGQRLQQIESTMTEIDFVRLPRKNFIFNKWMQASGWWPDYNIRFFRKGKIKWSDKIHRPPQTLGLGIDLEPKEEWAIVHHHYNDVFEYLEKMIRYTKIQSEELYDSGYRFDWEDLIKKPLSEFLGRFFVSKGYQDGVHGLVLSLLQAFSFLVLYIRVWEKEKNKPGEISLKELKDLVDRSGQEIKYWLKSGSLSKNPFKRILEKIKN